MILARTVRNTGIGLVMTDLFVSAAAALMMIIAITKPSPDIPLPIQADLIATCPSAMQLLSEASEQAALSVLPATPAEGIDPFLAKTPEDLWDLPEAFGLFPQLFYTIALVDGVEPVTAACADWVLNDLVRSANGNADASGTKDGPGLAPIFGLELTNGKEVVR